MAGKDAMVRAVLRRARTPRVRRGAAGKDAALKEKRREKRKKNARAGGSLVAGGSPSPPRPALPCA